MNVGTKLWTTYYRTAQNYGGREREKLISNVLKQDNWPVNKCDLVNKYIKHFNQFTNSIVFEKV